MNDIKMQNFSSANMTEYETKLNDALKAYLAKDYSKACNIYNYALTLATGKIQPCIIKYMICCCLVKSKLLHDLSEAVMILQNIDKSLKERFPSIYCLLAKAHCKLYRFDIALNTLNEADNIFNKNNLLETFYIPGTKIIIEQSKHSEIYIKAKQECESWHKPDAVCASSECNHITKPYVTPNKNIFKSDPAFVGMVVVYCNNKKRPCSLVFHPSCWKVIKDKTNTIQKVTDKDMINTTCFTPNCVNDQVSCKISIIQIIGPNGQLKTEIKESISDTWSVNKNTSKGAIKKQKIDTVKPQKHDVSADPKLELDFQKKPNLRDCYDENRLLKVINDEPYSNTSHEPACAHLEKTFLFSYFTEYIRGQYVRICDLYSSFADIKSDLIYSKDLDILTFLLDTKSVVVAIDDNSVSHNEDVGNMIDDLMNYDDYEDDNNFNIDQSNPQSYSHVMDKISKTNATSENYVYKTVTHNGDTSSYNQKSENGIDEVIKIKEIEENYKLKEDIASLKQEMRNIIEENSQLKKETEEKEYEINIYKKQIDDYEKFYEKMSDFKERYDVIKNENFKIKEEIFTLINDKKLLEEQITKLNDPDIRRKEFKKSFQAEYKILQDCMNKTWKQKTETLEKTLSVVSKSKKSMLQHYLNSQFNANKNLLIGYIEQCTIAIEIIDKVNNWMEKSASIKNFKDKSEWMNRLHVLQNAAAKLQAEFELLSDTVNSETPPNEVTLECPAIPNTVQENLCDIVMSTLNSFYLQQCEIIKNLKLNQQQQQQFQQQQFQQQQFQQQHFHQQQFQQQFQRPHAPWQMQQPPYQNYLTQQVMTLIASQNANFSQVPRLNNIQSPQMMQQPTLGIPPGFRVPVTSSESNGQIQEVRSDSVENIAVSMNSKLDIKNVPKEELNIVESTIDKSKSTENVEEPENQLENIEKYFDKLSEKRAQMQKALKAIALNANEKCESETSENNQGSTDEHRSNGFTNITDDKNKTENNNLQLKMYEDTFEGSNVTVKDDNSKSMKKTGINTLIKLMQKKYPGALEVDIIEIIMELRKKNNNSLTGKPVNEILSESEEYFLRNQRIHMLRYSVNEGSKSSCSDSSNNSSGSVQPSSLKDWISPASNITSLNGTDSPSSVQKKTWNVLPQQEAKWTASGEIECSICMGYVKKKNCYTLNCRHSFHTECIKKWLKSDRSCPNCRIAVTDDNEFPPLPA